MKRNCRPCLALFALPFFCVLFLLPACRHAPLSPNHGYPADWPGLIALAKGGAEINGTYANQGLATTPDGDLRPITLASLIPKHRPVAGHASVPRGEPYRGDSVRLVVTPPGSQWGLASLRAFITADDSIEGYEIEIGSDENVLLYVLELSGDSLGAVAGSTRQVRVFLTRAEDGSLIAQLHSEAFGVALVVPYYSSRFVWARFERIED